MEIILDKYNDISIKINHCLITGIYNCSNELLEVFRLNKIYKGNLIINDIKVDNKNIKVFKKRITIIDDNIDKYDKFSTVKEIYYEYIKRNNIELSNKGILKNLKLIGLNKDFLLKLVSDLSTLEIKILLISLGLLNDPSLILIKEPFKNIDIINKKKIINLFHELVEEKQKTIIFISDNIEDLYKYTDEIILCSNKYINGNTPNILQNVKLLKENGISIPEIVEITYLANLKKKAKLSYHKDIRDIIKDIYKHV